MSTLRWERNRSMLLSGDKAAMYLVRDVPAGHTTAGVRVGHVVYRHFAQNWESCLLNYASPSMFEVAHHPTREEAMAYLLAITTLEAS